MSVVTSATGVTAVATDVASGGAGNVTDNATSDVAHLRRGACPSLPRPMQTGDGLLARLQPLQPLTFQQLAGLAGLARELGNGIVEITARGKLQLRGLTSASAPRLPEAMDALGIKVPQGFAVEASALAGLDLSEIVDPRPLARAISDAAAGLTDALAPKASVVVDGGGALHLAALKADIAIAAVSNNRFHVTLGGVPAGEIAVKQAAETVLALLQRLAVAGETARMADLVAAGGVEALAREAGLIPAASPAPRPDAEPVGFHALRDGSVALGLGLAFGQVDAEALEGLAEVARKADARHVEPAAGRALLVVGLSRAAAKALELRAERLGFITDPADPRRRIFACAGKPACGSARIETHRLADVLAPVLRGGQVHVSGCPKGCAHPAKAGLTIVGLDEGAGLVVEGTARDVPLRIVPEARLAGAAREFLEKGEI